MTSFYDRSPAQRDAMLTAARRQILAVAVRPQRLEALEEILIGELLGVARPASGSAASSAILQLCGSGELVAISTATIHRFENPSTEAYNAAWAAKAGPALEDLLEGEELAAEQEHALELELRAEEELEATITTDAHGEPVAHAKGCRDLARLIPRSDLCWTESWSSRQELAEDFWGDMIAEGSMTPEHALAAMSFAPCLSRLA